MTAPGHVTAGELHRRLENGDPVLVVCGYRSPLAYRKYRIANAISLDDLDARLADLPRDQELVFYCACDADKTAILNAQGYMERGFASSKVLRDGFDAWHAAGYGA